LLNRSASALAQGEVGRVLAMGPHKWFEQQLIGPNNRMGLPGLVDGSLDTLNLLTAFVMGSPEFQLR
jgi:hypothetical protein